MKKFIYLIAVFLFAYQVQAQFDVEDYKEYLSTHQNMSFEQLLIEYPAGYFYDSAPTNFKKSFYADSIIDSLGLTDYEIELMNKNSFMVSDRLNYYTFIHAFWDIYNKDLPLYISSDAILHALHYSFDSYLQEIEANKLFGYLNDGLKKMKNYSTNFSNTVDSEEYENAMKDLDLYLTIALKLLKPSDNIVCNFEENEEELETLLKNIEELSPGSYPLFSSTSRVLDFSQFKPRGHYAEHYLLEHYFRCMIWLGRTEIQITKPGNEISVDHSPEDLKRMTILTALMCEAAFESGANEDLKYMEDILSYLLGVQDNINVWEVRDIMFDMNITSIDLTNDDTYDQFRENLLSLSSANQLYNSQILYADPTTPDAIEPPTVFLLMGQRPILDGFITANVVYDQVKEKRMVPSTLDILFSLGNDAAVQLLEPEITRYNYASNLAGLRYLIEGYEDDFWDSSTYLAWLNSIRSLNPPQDRENLPPFMQTAAWWQKTMNTQLASWSELRHDFLLYAKQSYSGGIGCSYPKAFIEPNVEFYTNIKNFWLGMDEIIGNNNSYLISHWVSVCDTLISISNKSLLNQELSKEEIDFYKHTIGDADASCGGPVGDMGWYPKLYYNYIVDDFDLYQNEPEEATETDKFTVADVHTIPTDADGNQVGWVLHAGTGRINLAVITSELPSGDKCSYVGPVYSYYEFLSNDFKRLTNQEWREINGAAPAYRPTFTNYYMADKDGNKPGGEHTNLYLKHVGIDDETPDFDNQLTINVAPNPFSNYVMFSFSISSELANKNAEFTIYDLNGNIVKTIINEPLFHNNYSLVWDGTNTAGAKVPQGTYIYSMRLGEEIKTGRVNLVR